MAEQNLQLEDWLDDLCVRFIINLPQEDLSTVARICFHVEEAQWFYEDFIRPLDPTLPSMSLRSFCLRIFQHCPLLSSFSVENHMRAFEEFLQYKTRVPVRGAILLNHAMDSTVLVKGWKKGASWSFPRGKINKDEDDLDCAIREVYEETGFDIKAAGLVPKDDETKFIQISMREQQIRLYVFKDIPMDTDFHPMTRKEISKIEWYKLSELPAFRKKNSQHHDGEAAASNANKFYMVAPFLVPLKKWVVQQKKKDALRAGQAIRGSILQDDPATEDDIGTHMDPIQETSFSTPAIETMEGATRELHRLLNITPQVTPGPAGSAPDKGASLMALLQTQGQEDIQPPPPPPHQHVQQSSQYQPASYLQQAVPGPSQLPHTPSDMVYVNAPEPQTPHFHHPTHPVAPNYYQQPPHFNMPQPMPQPMPQLVPQPMSQHMNVAHVQSHQFGQTAHIATAYHPQNRMPLQQPVMQNNGYMPYNTKTFTYANTHQPRQPILLHPQPLPPQVQQSLLVRGILPTPNLEAMARAGMNMAQMNNQNNQMVGQQAPGMTQPQASSIRPPQLNDQKMSLLNTFKVASQPAGPPTEAAPVPSSSFQAHGSQKAQDSTGNPAIPWASHPHAQMHAQYQAPSAQPAAVIPSAIGSNVPAPNALPVQHPQTTEKHRSALLGMFKQPGPLAPISSEGTTRISQVPNLAGAVLSDRSQSKPSPSAESIRAADLANGASVQLNSQIDLPFRTSGMHARPRQQEMENTREASLQSHKASPRAKMGSPRNYHASVEEENQAKKASHAAALPYTNSPSTTYQSPQLGQSQAAGSMSARRPDINPEQQNKLLSLFGKPAQSSSSPVPESKSKGKGKETVTEQASNPALRSRVASVTASADTGSTKMSRQNSLTPISPADRNFLLGYLQQQISTSNP